MAATLPAPPVDCTFDSLGLFTHGQFRCWQNPNPCLNLFTHGEFPRAVLDDKPGGPGGAQPGVGNAGRRRPQKVKVTRVCDIDDAIALALLLADDDDWW